MKKTFFLFFLSLAMISNAQDNNAQALFYNIGLGAVTGGIGAMINKQPQEKIDKVFLKGLSQGALGGAVVYGSKQMVYNFHKNEHYNQLWMAKMVAATGTSIIENAALNNNFWETWHINIGFNRLEVDIKNSFKIKYQVMPVAFIGTISAATKGNFNLKYSLQTLTPIFIAEDENYYDTTTLVNSIVITENRGIKRNLAHEYIHTLQYDDYMVFNSFFYKPKTKWQQKSNFINKTSKWIYMDLPGGATLRSLYLLENINQDCYFDNFFESEANFYSNKFTCP